MITTTLNKIREHEPCAGGWKKLLQHLGKTQPDDEPLSLVAILDSNGLDDCLWAIRTVPEHGNLWRKYAVWCVRQVQQLTTDPRSLEALDVAWRYSEGNATDKELSAAWAAASAAARAAASAAAWDAAWDAAWAAAWAAASAAGWDAARDAGWDAVRDAAWDAARERQEKQLRHILTLGYWEEA